MKEKIGSQCSQRMGPRERVKVPPVTWPEGALEQPGNYLEKRVLRLSAK